LLSQTLFLSFGIAKVGIFSLLPNFLQKKFKKIDVFCIFAQIKSILIKFVGL